MKSIFTIIITTFMALNAQTNEQVKKQLKDAGVIPDQVKQIAKDRGMTNQQIEAEAQARGINLDAADDGTEFQMTADPQIEPVLDKSAVLEPLETEKTAEEEMVLEQSRDSSTYADSERKAVSYYGYQIFQGDPDAFQASTFGAVDPNYNIGPGDQIIVMLWGESQFRQEFTIDQGGYVFVPEVGQIFVNGLNLDALEKKLFQTLSKVYSTLKPFTGKPTTFMDISLGNLRPLRIIVLGEVGQPGAYSVSPSTSLSSSLYYFSGPTTMGSLRDIRLIRKNKLIGSIDFYDYLLSGKAPEDLRLQLDDIIFIPPRANTVSISGEINRPAIYELRDNEGLQDLIEIAGGPRITTYMNRAQIDRVVAPENRTELGMDRMLVDVDLNAILSSKQDYPLQDGDRVKLFSILNLRENTVSISGAVARPGTYEYGNGLTLRDLILRADNLVGDAYLERADVIRINPDFSEKLLKLDIQAAMAESAEHNLLLQPMDQVHIYGLTEMVGRQFVSILGYVQTPGRYALRENMNLYDLVFKGGGLADDEWLEKTYMERADLIRMDKDNITSRVIPFNLGKLINNPHNQNNAWILEPSDMVRIYSKDMFNVAKNISIDGSVRNPGSYKLKSNMNIKDLILEAGGVTEDVYRYKIEVARIDPMNTNRKIYAQILTLDMDSDFSISNIQYDSTSNPDELSVIRNEFIIKPYDRISIRPDPNFSLQRTVTINGEINYPGTYTLTNPKERVSDIIHRAGGLRSEAYPKASILIRNDQIIRLSFDELIKNERSKENFELLDGDSIIINAHPHIVTIIGAVNTPGIYKYYKNNSLRKYINIAGGLTVNAEVKEIFVTYPDGRSKQLKRLNISDQISFPIPWLSPRVYDGSVISIGMKPEAEPFDATEYAKEMTSILTNLAQTLILMKAIQN